MEFPYFFAPHSGWSQLARSAAGGLGDGVHSTGIQSGRWFGGLGLLVLGDNVGLPIYEASCGWVASPVSPPRPASSRVSRTVNHHGTVGCSTPGVCCAVLALHPTRGLLPFTFYLFCLFCSIVSFGQVLFSFIWFMLLPPSP